MGIGNSLFNARKKKGISQETAAGKLGVSRQTVSKWETGETLPDIQQAKKLAVLYGLSLDELIEFDAGIQEIQDIVNQTSEETAAKIDWTKLWSSKYPVLGRYKQEVDTALYTGELRDLLNDLKKRYGYEELDAFLVLKDILAGLWQPDKPAG